MSAGVLGPRDEQAVRELLARLERDVDVLLELGPEETPVTVLAGGRDIQFGEEARRLVEAVAATSERVRLEVRETDRPGGRYPRLTIGGRLRYDGLPWGYELATLVHGIVEAGRLRPSLTAASLEALGSLERDVGVEVYVTPT